MVVPVDEVVLQTGLMVVPGTVPPAPVGFEDVGTGPVGPPVSTETTQPKPQDRIGTIFRHERMKTIVRRAMKYSIGSYRNTTSIVILQVKI